MLGAVNPSPVITDSSELRVWWCSNAAVPSIPRLANTPKTKPARPAVGRGKCRLKHEGTWAESDPNGQIDVVVVEVAAQHAKASTMECAVGQAAEVELAEEPGACQGVVSCYVGSNGRRCSCFGVRDEAQSCAGGRFTGFTRYSGHGCGQQREAV